MAMKISISSRPQKPPYAEYHRARFSFLLALIRKFVPRNTAHLLEVGRGPFTNDLFREYQNLTTLGFPLEAPSIAQAATYDERIGHIVFNLNHARKRQAWPQLPGSDAIILAEVIEHLTAAPEHVLTFLASGLKPGGILIVQTPNAVTLTNRLKLLAGRNPFERIRLHDDPGHFREYTKDELIEIADHAGLSPVAHFYRNYFQAFHPFSRALDVLTDWTLPSLRRGQTVVFKKAAADG